MQCMRDGTLMLRSHHEEVEDIGEYQRITQVYINECPVCACMVKVVLPVLPGEEVTGVALP